MFSYLAYGLGIHSSVRLPSLEATDIDCDVRIKMSRGKSAPAKVANKPWHFEVNPEEAFLSFKDVGSFYVNRGREVRVMPAPGVDQRLIYPYLLGTIMAVVLYQRGLEVDPWANRDAVYQVFTAICVHDSPLDQPPSRAWT